MKLKRIISIMAVLFVISAFLVSCKNKESETGDITPVPSTPLTTTLNPIRTPLPVITPSLTPVPEEEFPIEFTEHTFTINGRENHVFLMKVDIADDRVKVVPYLSFGKIYGFETLTEMVGETGAYAGVNSGFFFEYGRPSGLVVIDGETVSPGTGRFESIIISEGEIDFKTIETTATLTIGDTEVEINTFNLPYEENKISAYSKYYGNTDRSDVFRKYLLIENNKVIDFGLASIPKSIPSGGYTVNLPPNYEIPENIMEMDVFITISPSFSKGTIAYEGASMLLKDGLSLAGDIMPWVGNLNHFDPRTCIGKLSDGKLGLVVVDGRQDGYSTGITGRETADILLNLGFTDAFMLDGGASSSMYIEDRIVNNPSDKGIERVLAGAVLIFID